MAPQDSDQSRLSLLRPENDNVIPHHDTHISDLSSGQMEERRSQDCSGYSPELPFWCPNSTTCSLSSPSYSAATLTPWNLQAPPSPALESKVVHME
ncbi:hypothetical protein PanWU01x14_181190 [Parasponia andersonii]|uniref:Uncharacterized protein n=1 Tax=Parasponia andersonii TaxID=3476 RepID=A0A2P5C5U3_PARAD|nr:hypothetical protein PanWU01x14_181190 [Parasponia andersonii]